MAYYFVRRVALTAAVNTPTAVNLDTEGNTAGAITVPQGVGKISRLIFSISASIVAVASAGVNIACRLTGNALKNGQQEIPIGSLREDTTSTGGAKIIMAAPLDVDIEVTPGNDLNISVSQMGVDPGSPDITVGVEFT